MYRIGVGWESSLIPIHVILYHCTDSYPAISFLFKISCQWLRWWHLVSPPPQGWHLQDVTSHILRLTLAGRAKSTFVGYFSKRLTSLWYVWISQPSWLIKFSLPVAIWLSSTPPLVEICSKMHSTKQSRHFFAWPNTAKPSHPNINCGVVVEYLGGFSILLPSNFVRGHRLMRRTRNGIIVSRGRLYVYCLGSY